MNFADYPVHALMEISARPPLVFTRGEGSRLWDHEGRSGFAQVWAWAAARPTGRRGNGLRDRA